MATEFVLPDLGEGVEVGDVVSVLVSEGDQIETDQGVVELETDKALIEVPCPIAGTVSKVHVQAGDRVPPGAALLTVEAGAEAPAPADAAETVSEPAPVPEPESPPEPEPAPEPEAPPPAVPAEPGAPIPAAPATRRFARELGVDLGQVSGTGPGGRIVKDDVQVHVRDALAGGNGTAPVAAAPLPDFAKWGEIERQPLPRIRQVIAQNLHQAWNRVPHVTQFDQADVTDLEAFRQRHKDAVQARGGRLTPTVLVLKAVITALKAFPQFNASLDMAARERILKHYYNLGIAVDTERGLMVPVIQNADRKDIFELAAELGDISERTRTNKIALEDLQGGTFTVTNLGSLGVGAFTPIVNHPEVAILGLGRSREEAVVRNGRIEPRLMMPMCLSYDHRIIDGADGARFTRKLAESLEEPERLLLGG